MKLIKDFMVARTPLKKRTIKKEKQPALFQLTLTPLGWERLKLMECPKCYKRIYWNRAQTIIRCKSKLHSFVLTKKSYEDIVSGKRLKDWQETDRLNRR